MVRSPEQQVGEGSNPLGLKPVEEHFFKVVGLSSGSEVEAQERFREAFPKEYFAEDPAVAGGNLETVVQCHLHPISGEQVYVANQQQWHEGVVLFCAKTAIEAGNLYPDRRGPIEGFMGKLGMRLSGLNRLGTEVGVTINSGVAGGRPFNRIADRNNFLRDYKKKLDALTPIQPMTENVPAQLAAD